MTRCFDAEAVAAKKIDCIQNKSDEKFCLERSDERNGEVTFEVG